MCLILFAIDKHPKYKLVLAANRDEFYNRPTLEAGRWEDDPEIIGGRDMEKGGTWFAVKEGGKWGAVTNYRDGAKRAENKKTRGFLIPDYLNGELTPREYLHVVERIREKFDGFNLLTGNYDNVYYYSNRGTKIIKVPAGIYGLSNHLLDTPWFKVTEGKKLLEAELDNKNVNTGRLFEILANTDKSPDKDLPDTGIPVEFEKELSSSFIKMPEYGTRSSMVFLIDRDNNITFTERTFDNGELRNEKTFRLPP